MASGSPPRRCMRGPGCSSHRSTWSATRSRAEPMAIINPEITPLVQEIVEDWEGCLSIPDISNTSTKYIHLPPPPCGWSRVHRYATIVRALAQPTGSTSPIETFSCSDVPTRPMVAMQSTSTRRISPEGSFSSAYSDSRETSWA